MMTINVEERIKVNIAFKGTRKAGAIVASKVGREFHN